MKKLILLLITVLLFSCAPKIVYLPTTEYVRVEIHDTIDSIRLVPVFVKIQTKDTISNLDNTWAYSRAMWSNGYLTHSLGIKPVAVPVVVPVTTIYKDKTITVNLLTPEQTGIIKDYPKVTKERDGLKQDVAKLKVSAKKRAGTIWKLIGIISLLTLWTLRKPLLKLIKPI